MDRVIKRWLARAPLLLTAYLAWINRGRWRGPKALTAVGLFIAWMAAASVYVHVDRAAAISKLAWLHRHDLFLAVISAIVAGMLLARRRTLNRIAASRSWMAALPVEKSTAKWQVLVIDSAPALVLAGVLAAVFGSLTLIALAGASISAPTAAWAAMTGGVALGAGLSCLLPTGKQEEMYEGSRYVPHRRRAETPTPGGSLSALGSWPVRQMFASARPKTIARAIVPVLLSVPLGSTAADVMVAIGLVIAIGALVLLVAAAVSVSAKASAWLKPAPLGAGVLARRTLLPALGLMCCAAAIEAWLLVVLGSSPARCLAIAVSTLVVSMIIAVAGALFAVYASDRGQRGRL
jgi:hypothetical protein